MNGDGPGITIFKSGEPKAFAIAATLLKASGIPFQVVEKDEGDIMLPRLVHYLVVSAEHADAAQERIANVPSEAILPRDETTEPPGLRPIYWALLITMAIAVVTATVIMLLNR